MPDDRDQPLSEQGLIFTQLAFTTGSCATPELRFVERPATADFGARSVRILQQKWQVTTYHDGMPSAVSYVWKDVPLAVEE